MIACLAVLIGCTTGDPAVRPDHLVLNESLPLTQDTEASWPLYLTRRGEYYVEVTLAAAPGQALRPLEGLRLRLAIVDGESSLLERERDVALGARRPATTLAWFTSDREVPLKDRVTMRLTASGIDAATAVPQRLLVQVRRKLNRTLPR